MDKLWGKLILQLVERNMADLWKDFKIREMGTGQQEAQLHDRHDDDNDDDDDDVDDDQI